MGEHQQPTQTSAESWTAWQLMHLSFEIGFIKAVANRTLAICEDTRSRLMAMETQPTGQANWLMSLRQSAKEWFEHYELLQKIWRLYRALPWGWLATGLYALARWLHVF